MPHHSLPQKQLLPSKPDTILIVDDMKVNRAILRETFKDMKVLEAANGLEALNIICNSPQSIAAVLLDLIMPVMDGFQLLEYLKKMNLLKHIPIFLITADTSEKNMHRGYDMGVMDIIEKPVIPYFLRRRVQNIMELYQTRASLSGLVDVQEQQLEQQAEEIQELNRALITTLSTAIEFRDCESGEHVQRIYDLTSIILTNLREAQFHECRNFTNERIEQIATAAIMHDVGKISIPDAILKKPGKLTPEEFDIIKTHTIKGCEILDQIPKFRHNLVYQYAYDICRHHHERWDGHGYPDGLKGNQITIWSQVVALADVYDALTNARVYKPAFSHEQAMEMIFKGQCGSFSPRLMKAVEKFSSLFIHPSANSPATIGATVHD